MSGGTLSWSLRCHNLKLYTTQSTHLCKSVRSGATVRFRTTAWALRDACRPSLALHLWWSPYLLGSLVLGSPCFSLDTSRILGWWSRRAVCTISSTFTNASHASVRSRCHGRVWRSRYMLDHTSGCTDGSSDVLQLLQTSLSARLGSSAVKVSSRQKREKHFPLHCTISHIISDYTCGEVCNMVACGRYGRQ